MTSRLVIALALGLAAAIFATPGAWALTHSVMAALPIGAVAGALVGVLAFRSALLRRSDEYAPPRALALIAVLAAAGAFAAYGRMAVFMVAPSKSSYSFMPANKWETAHSCATAYYVAARAADSRDVYDSSLYTASDDDPARPRKPLKIGPFNVDVFEYPPPFLLLPRVLRLVAPDFESFRALWFAQSTLFVLFVMVVVTSLLPPAVATRALFLLPLAWVALPALSVVQKGNVQAMVIASSMLGMALIERGRRAAGGLFLAFATVSKLYPGMLIVYLLVRRDWRAVGWTAAFALSFAVAAAVDVGPGVYGGFASHMPGLLSGEAFPAFRNPAAVAINYSIPGMVFKLALFGIPGASFAASRIAGWIYTVIALWATVLLARCRNEGAEAPLAWLAVLIFATLRSPFLPSGYAGVPGLWLLILAAARYRPTPNVLAGTLAAWGLLGIFVSVESPLGPRAAALITLIPQSAMLLLAVLVVRGQFNGLEPAPGHAGVPRE